LDNVYYEEASMPYLQSRPDGNLVLSLHVQPGASGTALAGFHGQALKLRLAAPPLEGKANQALLAYLAELLHLPKSALVLISGHNSRSKKVLIMGISEHTARSFFLEHNRGSSGD
jgi:uncharacterized protein